MHLNLLWLLHCVIYCVYINHPLLEAWDDQDFLFPHGSAVWAGSGGSCFSSSCYLLARVSKMGSYSQGAFSKWIEQAWPSVSLQGSDCQGPGEQAAPRKPHPCACALLVSVALAAAGACPGSESGVQGLGCQRCGSLFWGNIRFTPKVADTVQDSHMPFTQLPLMLIYCINHKLKINIRTIYYVTNFTHFLPFFC